ncbi:MAG: phosphomannomutase/phosphoglucomutase [Actinomycetota bacterium]|nr:phosphomannomutase/phosphoglucomutase [Actinomycetota bacterium]
MDLDTIFKAYDVRGLYPSQIDEEAARRIGRGFATFAAVDRIAVGRDCRTSSPGIASALMEGITATGTDVIDIGEITTDGLYFVSGSMDLPGVVVTASHNPPEYNGLKFCLAGAAPVGEDTGLSEIKRIAASPYAQQDDRGSIEVIDTLDGYVDHLFGVIDASVFASLTVTADGGNGMAGVAIPTVFDRLPARLIGLYLDPDGTFPNHPADPLRPENLVDLLALMAETRPDLGVAFDGDADRAFFIDDRGVPLPGSTTTAIIGDWFLRREPGASVVHNLICSKAVPERVIGAGGIPVRTRVGHSFIKQVMKETGAVFGGEHSGHYYFRDNYRADSGILAMLVLMQVMSEDGRPLSELRLDYEPYVGSGEINYDVADQAAATAAVAAAYSDAQIDHLDGLTVDLGDRWFNLRPSNTEPKLRLNAEAPDAEAVDDLVAAVASIIEEGP